ncbi:serine aminopeptidase domain-containing protein [Roseovarius salinarum]|uniref:serine aminopeptidase domain-containing protein n=1 Tax=Roseovarius salinarum TaxID=1981892 RepID=UPI0018E454E9|nr:alpha/beta hydrolase [Roseovarius salinarum]
MKCSYLARTSGPPLFHRHWPAVRRAGAPRRQVFLGHSQPTHSGLVDHLALSFQAAGWDVQAGDIRGHGRSTDSRFPLGHLATDSGWQQAIEDQRAPFETAFAQTPWEDRLVVMPNITALLTLEVLKTWPDLARDIVLISPPPNQRALARFGLAFSRARVLLRGEAEPDEHSLHHLYAFLGAHLKSGRGPGDVMSADPDSVNRVLDDPLGWPTPSTGYWVSIFSGMLSAWTWHKHQSVTPGTRCFILYGSEDAMLRDGGFLAPVQRTLDRAGFAEVATQKVEGGRSALFLDERRLGIRDRILAWRDGEAAPESSQPQITMPVVAREICEGLLPSHDDPDKAHQAMLQVFFEAVENETRWTEMLYAMIAEIDETPDLDEDELQDRLNRLMPHWDRSFSLNRQIMLSSSFGLYLSAVTDRLNIGVAVLDRSNRPLQNNAAFLDILRVLFPGLLAEVGGARFARVAVDRLFADSSDETVPTAKGRERVLRLGDRPVGLQMIPNGSVLPGGPALGAQSILLVRAPQDAGDTRDQRLSLLTIAYELTPKEAEIALLVARGRAIPEVAETLGIAPSTARSHLKVVFQKMRVNSQNELIARIMSSPVGWYA